ncbi:transmembrane emp24 domain-containing protein p24beta2-like [Olea europaea var. sylvestris]|uniref:transmembrane emp24 domain-containing protein p24beta2-like n=1 Tax=Olea europaea var. sylvestris TaxID=158386 RepID=UPI000C1D8929|nr:transmembrane emp24 domain-containing protein p24beta2-like [Olea europaea var. sylvestris]
MILMVVVLSMQGVIGIRFVLNKEECVSYNVEYEGETVHISFVAIKADATWHYGDDGIDLMIKGPSGDPIHEFRDKTSETYEFLAHRRGVYRFCFKNKSPYHETVDFDVHVTHFFSNQHAKDEHFKPLLEQISKLEDALYNIQFEQHWLQAQSDRQTFVNEGMRRGAIQKAILESVALIGSSVLQLYLLRRIFEHKRRISRV